MSIVAVAARHVLPAPALPPITCRLDADTAERVGAGRFGDDGALNGYATRAKRIARRSMAGACLAAVAALGWHPAWWAVAVPLALGALFDHARGKLACKARIDGDALVVETGPWAGRRLSRDDVAAVGFGAPARGSRRAPDAFWRGDFDSPGASSLVLVRLVAQGSGPRRLVVPEGGVPEARAVVRALRAWLVVTR